MRNIQRLVGRVTALSRFIPKLAEQVRPIVKKTKRDSTCKWDAECTQAFVEIKTILINPPIMNKPIPGEDLQIYLGVSDTDVSAVLLQGTVVSKARIFR